MEAQMISVKSVVPSKTNQRAKLDKTALAELTESVKRHEVLQPILVRQVDRMDSAVATVAFEVVCGERRLAAAVAAGLEQIPATVRTLTDAEAIELQVIENLQRADLHPMEEAEGYLQLTKRGYSVEDLAAKVSKSRSYVHGRLRLTSLHPTLKKAFAAGELTPATAFLFARVTDQKIACEVYKRLSERIRWLSEAGPLNHREVKDELDNAALRDLDDAPFDATSPTLLPSAGPCTACPKRSGNQPDLFSDVKGANTCTDPGCFKAKSDAAWKLRCAAARDAGQKTLEGDAAKKALRHGSDFANLDERDWASPGNRTFRQQLKQAGATVVPVIARDPDSGSVVELVPRRDLVKLLPRKKSAAASPDTKYRLEHEKRKVRERAMVAAARDALVAWIGKLGLNPAGPTSELGLGLFWDIVERFAVSRSQNDSLAAMVKRLGVERGETRRSWGKVKEGFGEALARHLATLRHEPAQRVAIVVELMLSEGAYAEKGRRGALDVVAENKLCDPDKAGEAAVADLLARRRAQQGKKRARAKSAAKVAKSPAPATPDRRKKTARATKGGRR